MAMRLCPLRRDLRSLPRQIRAASQQWRIRAATYLVFSFIQKYRTRLVGKAFSGTSSSTSANARRTGTSTNWFQDLRVIFLNRWVVDMFYSS